MKIRYQNKLKSLKSWNEKKEDFDFRANHQETWPEISLLLFQYNSSQREDKDAVASLQQWPIIQQKRYVQYRSGPGSFGMCEMVEHRELAPFKPDPGYPQPKPIPLYLSLSNLPPI